MTSVKLSDVIAPVYFETHRDIMAGGHTHYDISGGRGSGKSSFVSVEVVLLLISHKDTHAAVFRRYKNTLRTSVFAQYIWAVGMLGLSDKFTAHTSPMELIYKPTGQRIIFFGLDDEMKLKSIKPPFGYIAVTHFEEKDQFTGREQIRSVLQSTQRGGDDFWNFETYNPPISSKSWANVDALIQREDRLCIKTTYLDIPQAWLSPVFIDEAEYLRVTAPRAYEHEYLGIPTGTGGQVFERVTVREIDETFERLYRGIDWGWYPDPFAYVKCAYEPAKRRLYILEEYGANKQSNEQTASKLRRLGVGDGDLIIADSAEPKSISDYRAYGFNCRAAEKGPGTVEYSMKWLQSLEEIIINTSCPKAAKEFTQYEYERTRTGEILNVYPDRDNHFIDAVRYAMSTVWRKKGR